MKKTAEQPGIMEKLAGGLLLALTFLMPLKFGTLAVMPEATGLYPGDLFSWAIISWPAHSFGLFSGGLLLLLAPAGVPVRAGAVLHARQPDRAAVGRRASRRFADRLDQRGHLRLRARGDRASGRNRRVCPGGLFDAGAPPGVARRLLGSAGGGDALSGGFRAVPVFLGLPGDAGISGIPNGVRRGGFRPHAVEDRQRHPGVRDFRLLQRIGRIPADPDAADGGDGGPLGAPVRAGETLADHILRGCRRDGVRDLPAGAGAAAPIWRW